MFPNQTWSLTTFVIFFLCCYVFADDDLLDAIHSNWYDDTLDNYNYEINHGGGGGDEKTSSNLEISKVCNGETQLFYCHCGREYKSKGSLTDHRRWECGKNPSFQCPYCEYCAKRKKHLRRHVLCVHKVPFTLEQADMARIEVIE